MYSLPTNRHVSHLDYDGSAQFLPIPTEKTCTLRFQRLQGRGSRDHGDRFLNEFTEFIQKPVPMIFSYDLTKTLDFMFILCEFFVYSSPPYTIPLPPHRREGWFVLAIWCLLFHFTSSLIVLWIECRRFGLVPSTPAPQIALQRDIAVEE